MTLRSISAAAPAWRATLAMIAMELRLALRRGETLVATAVLPVVVLVFFSSVLVLPSGSGVGRPVDFVLPGSIAFAVIATSLVNLGITTGYDRSYGVLKRLGGSPLSRPELLTAKVAGVLVVEAVQVALLVAVAALVLGWQPGRRGRRRRSSSSRSRSARSRSPVSACCCRAPPRRDDARRCQRPVPAGLTLGGIVVPVDHLPSAWPPSPALCPRRRCRTPSGGARRAGCAAGCGRAARDPGDLGRRGGAARRPHVPLGVAGKGRTPVVGTGVLVESLVAGEGFEPPTFGL